MRSSVQGMTKKCFRTVTFLVTSSLCWTALRSLVELDLVSNQINVVVDRAKQTNSPAERLLPSPLRSTEPQFTEDCSSESSEKRGMT